MTKITKNPVTQNHRRVIQSILGSEGHVCSWSKSCGPALAVYNSHVLLDGVEIWHGDVILDFVMRGILERYAVNNKVSIEVNYESGGKCWSTDDIGIMDGMPIEEAVTFRSTHREKMVKSRLSSYGILTPRETEWTWYNRWFYKGPYVIGYFFYGIYNTFIGYPLSYYRLHEGTKWMKIKRVWTIFKKEFHYQRFKGGFFHFWIFKLDDDNHPNYGCDAPGN